MISSRTTAIPAVLLAALSASAFLMFAGGTCYESGNTSLELRNPLLTPAIEMRADEAGLTDLRTMVFKQEEIEVRIWIEPMMRIEVAEGYVLRRTADSRTGKHLLPVEKNPGAVRNGQAVVFTPPPSGTAKTIDVEPLNGWDYLWTSLTNTGLLTLPDETELDCTADTSTGDVLYLSVVEIKTSEMYWSYRYTSPERYSRPETRSMARILQILREEFSTDQQE